MEKQVIFRNNQEFQADDPNNLQGFVADSLEHIVADGISAGTHYAGLLVAPAGTTTITVAPGRLYSGGKVYTLDQEQNFDLFQFLPVQTSKIVAIVAWPNEIETDVEPRDFLVDVATGATQPQAVAMQRARVCQVDRIAGVESASPQPPNIPSTTLLIALVTLTPSGVAAVQMQETNELPQVDDLSRRTSSLEAWRTQTDPRVSTITSDLAKLAQGQSQLAPLANVQRMGADVARLKDMTKLPDTYSDYSSDHFLDAAKSDLTQPGFSAKVQEGVRFPDAASAPSQLALLNPIDPTVSNHDGFLLPAWQKVIRMANLAGFAGADYLSSFQFQTTEQVLLERSRQRIRYGAPQTVCTNMGYLNGRDITLDTASGFFTKNGETFQYLPGAGSGDINKDHQWIRIQQVWIDTYQEPYWQINPVTQTVTGSQVSQVFLNPQDGWIVEFGLYFNDIGPSGQVQVSLCKADNGQPDVKSVIASVTLQQSDLKKYPLRTAVTIPPTFLEGGRRYAIVVQSGGQHSVGSVAGSVVPQGTYNHFLDGAFQSVTGNKSLMFDLAFASFGVSYLPVSMQPLSLAGGINAVDILMQAICPKSCQIRFEVQVAGTWYPLTTESALANIFAGAPPLVPLRAVFVGTPDVMPGFGTTGSQVVVARPATSFAHFSKPRTLPAATTTVRVLVLVENWDAAAHTVGCQLIVAGNPVAATVVADLPSDSGVMKQFSFTVPSTSSYVIKLTGTTTDATKIFHVAERTDISF